MGAYVFSVFSVLSTFDKEMKNSEGKTDGLAISPATGATFDYDGELFSSPGSNLSPQYNVFTPQHVLDGRLNYYISLPVLDENVTYKKFKIESGNQLLAKLMNHMVLCIKGIHQAVMLSWDWQRILKMM